MKSILALVHHFDSDPDRLVVHFCLICLAILPFLLAA
mgnify:FL=1